jgi:hypothetical protein
VEGTTLSWALYLLNLFLDDYKNVKDLGKKIHYSWLLILIALLGWKDLKYSFFSTILKPCHATRYISLGSVSDPKKKQANATIFEGYYNDLHERITNTWRVTPKVVA